MIKGFNLFAVLLVSACYMGGCITPNPPSEGGVTAAMYVRPDVPTLNSSSFMGETRVSDEQFELVYSTNDAKLDCKDPNVDIRDLQAFAITVYREKLQDKLRSGRKLNGGEVELLKFVCYVQHLSLSCFTAYAYVNLIGSPQMSLTEFHDGPKESDRPANQDLFCRAVENFGQNGNVLAKLIDCWVKEARSPDAVKIFEEIVSPEYGKQSSNKFLKISPHEFFLCTVLGYGSYVYECRLQDATNKPRDGAFFGDEYVQMFKEIEQRERNNKQRALLWGRVADSLRFYSQDLGELHRDLGESITKAADKRTKRDIEDLRIKYASWCEDDFYKFREVYYAYPFIQACNKLNEQVQDARHSFWFNNTDAMESATMMFCETTSIKNNEMIRNLNSRYAAKVYGDTLKELKKRAGKRVYGEIQAKCRLWSLDDPEFELGDEIFGRRRLKWHGKDGKIETEEADEKGET